MPGWIVGVGASNSTASSNSKTESPAFDLVAGHIRESDMLPC